MEPLYRTDPRIWIRRYLALFSRLREKGMQFVVASGRPWASVESAFEPVKKKIFYVANNGAYVGCHGRCLYAYTMERELAHRIIARYGCIRSWRWFMPV